MSRNRQIALAAAMFFALAPAGVAGAQATGCDFSVCPPADEEPIAGERPGGGGEAPTGAPGGVEGESGSRAPGGGESQTGAPAVGVVRGESGSAAPGDVAARSQETRAAAVAAAPSGSLPVTGGDLAALAAIGMGAVATGAVLVRRSRRTSASVTA